MHKEVWVKYLPPHKYGIAQIAQQISNLLPEAIIIAPTEEVKAAGSGDNDTINASVSGQNLILDINTIATTVKGYNMQLQFANTTATLTDNILNWQTDLEAIVSVSGMNIRVGGQLTMNATNLTKAK